MAKSNLLPNCYSAVMALYPYALYFERHFYTALPDTLKKQAEHKIHKIYLSL